MLNLPVVYDDVAFQWVMESDENVPCLELHKLLDFLGVHEGLSCQQWVLNFSADHGGSSSQQKVPRFPVVYEDIPCQQVMEFVDKNVPCLELHRKPDFLGDSPW